MSPPTYVRFKGGEKRPKEKYSHSDLLVSCFQRHAFDHAPPQSQIREIAVAEAAQFADGLTINPPMRTLRFTRFHPTCDTFFDGFTYAKCLCYCVIGHVLRFRWLCFLLSNIVQCCTCTIASGSMLLCSKCMGAVYNSCALGSKLGHIGADAGGSPTNCYMEWRA